MGILAFADRVQALNCISHAKAAQNGTDLIFLKFLHFSA
jgi:hypothetical protein